MQSSNPSDRFPTVEPLTRSLTQSQTSPERIPQDSQFAERILRNLPGVVYLFDVVTQQPIYISSQMQRVLGYSLEALQEMGSEFMAQIMHPEDWARLAQHFEQLDRTPLEESLEFEYRMRHANGEWRWFISQDRVFQRTPDGQLRQVLGIAQDITTRKQAELELHESRMLHEAIFNDSTDALFLVNPATLRTVDCNQRAVELFQASEKSQLIDIEGRQLHRQPLSLQERDAIVDSMQYGVWVQEIEYVTCQGNYFWGSLAAKPVTVGDRTINLVRITDVTRFKQAEQAISRSEQFVRRVLNSLFSFVGVMTPEGVLIEANQTALSAASLRPEDVLGKPVEETYWWSHSPTVQAQLREAIQRAAEGEVVRYDVQVRLGENQFIVIDFALVPMRDEAGQIDYLIPSGIDISDRKQVEADLQESRAALQRELLEIEAIYRTAPIGLGVLDTDLRFVRVNQRLAEINGITAEAHIGRTVRELLPQLADETEAQLRQVLTGTPLLNVEIHGETPAQPGVRRTWMEHWLPLRDQGQVIGISIVCEEITDRKRTEESLRQSEAQLRKQTEQLIQANQVKDEFLAVLSHELRTPLNPILGWAKLLQTRPMDGEKMQHALMAIERNARLQVQLIDDLLDISRIIRGKLILNLAPVSLLDAIGAALETLNQAATAKRIVIETCLDGTLGKITGDGGRLQQLMWNLLSNAIKFTPEGGRVRVLLERVDRHAQIQVSDTGKGIQPEFLPHLFEMFRQQDSSTTRQFGGLGLGLAISKQLVEAHGGTIVASSPGEGQGATFTVRLPLAEPPGPETTVSPPQSSQPNSLQGIRVLVVDDETDTLELMNVFLEMEGAIVLTAASAQKALNRLARFPVDVLVSDIQMPQMDGYAFIRQVRSLSQFSQLPAIAITAHAYETDRELALAAGYQSHLTKPLDPTALVEAILELMANRR